MESTNQIIEGEIATTRDSSPRSVTVSPSQLRKQMKRDEDMRAVINEYIKNNMVDGKDYGSIEIKGHKSKPGLLKPGAEKFCGLFKIRPTFKKDTDTLEMLGNRPGLIAYICELVDSRGEVAGEGRGTAKTDPVNGDDFNINKQVKIAEKRAQIDAVLRTGGLSDFFTQDIEDMPRNAVAGDTESRPASIKQKNLIAKLFLERGANTPNLLLDSIEANGIANAKEMTTNEASELIEKLFANNAETVTKQAEQSDEEREHIESIVGRGPGDPDVHGYPGQDEVFEDELSDEQIAEGLAKAEKELLGNEGDQGNE